MAAGIATNDVMVQEDTPARSAVRGEQFRKGLETLQQEHAWIGEVRGMGLMQALELVEDRTTKQPSLGKAKALLQAAKEEGILLGVAACRATLSAWVPQCSLPKKRLWRVWTDSAARVHVWRRDDPGASVDILALAGGGRGAQSRDRVPLLP